MKHFNKCMLSLSLLTSCTVLFGADMQNVRAIFQPANLEEELVVKTHEISRDVKQLQINDEVRHCDVGALCKENELTSNAIKKLCDGSVYIYNKFNNHVKSLSNEVNEIRQTSETLEFEQERLQGDIVNLTSNQEGIDEQVLSLTDKNRKRKKEIQYLIFSNEMLTNQVENLEKQVKRLQKKIKSTPLQKATNKLRTIVKKNN